MVVQRWDEMDNKPEQESNSTATHKEVSDKHLQLIIIFENFRFISYALITYSICLINLVTVALKQMEKINKQDPSSA